ncbi:hypothetical protein KAFR_0F02540 [Kazachstania africana CBS 2517]|uniref:Alkyl transferase n=1 Tax=Kazachstania africana (strain ATCC 22294 / BCRC 22015 / CBS 2517 / CECT 1963 / NBRC 1671 / NRRL Y-8276) TaxID=1071382 RepID=H2AWV1_KAZAF|nr:hypothetical protein KAFR_0F02540 [Kazachstania africana CBS 2517]CCF58851.1 hypothetical protein KAFR_0F02540 [Kazachstania africana CBS 2517]
MSSEGSIPGSNSLLSLVKNTFSRTLRSSNCVPQHVGFVMDGNRRYSIKKEIEIKEGHEAGFVSMSRILELCYESGVTTATVFAFSIENFKRSPYEVQSLMDLAKKRIRQLTTNGNLAQKYGIRIRVIGDLSLLDEDLLKEIKDAVELTKDNKRSVLNICFPYTGREEILHSMKEVITERKVKGNTKIGEYLIDRHLYTGGLPPLDLLIRTSGVSRLSDFMLWQVSNKGVTVELLNCLWPEFGPSKMAWILLKFAFKKSLSDRSYTLEKEDESTSDTSLFQTQTMSIKAE